MEGEGKEKLKQMFTAGQLLTQKDVLKIWPISRDLLSSLTNHPNEEKRLPSYRYGRLALYAPEELMWYREKMRYVPRRKRGKR